MWKQALQMVEGVISWKIKAACACSCAKCLAAYELHAFAYFGVQPEPFFRSRHHIYMHFE